MATIRASCASCGDVELTSRDLTVRVCRDDGTGSYTFPCPACRQISVRSAEPRIIELLVTSGVRIITWSLPAELNEIHEGPVISHDDILDFHALLQTDGWIDAVHRQTST